MTQEEEHLAGLLNLIDDGLSQMARSPLEQTQYLPGADPEPTWSRPGPSWRDPDSSNKLMYIGGLILKSEYSPDDKEQALRLLATQVKQSLARPSHVLPDNAEPNLIDDCNTTSRPQGPQDSKTPGSSGTPGLKLSGQPPIPPDNQVKQSPASQQPQQPWVTNF